MENADLYFEQNLVDNQQGSRCKISAEKSSEQKLTFVFKQKLIGKLKLRKRGIKDKDGYLF